MVFYELYYYYYLRRDKVLPAAKCNDVFLDLDLYWPYTRPSLGLRYTIDVY